MRTFIHKFRDVYVDGDFIFCLFQFKRRIKSFKALNNRIFFKCRQAFTIANILASSGLWKMLYLPIFILTTGGTIGFVMSDICYQMVWHQPADTGPYTYPICDVLTQTVRPL